MKRASIFALALITLVSACTEIQGEDWATFENGITTHGVKYPPGVKYCPVSNKQFIDGVELRFRGGQHLDFCCPVCVQQFKQTPRKFIWQSRSSCDDAESYLDPVDLRSLTRTNAVYLQFAFQCLYFASDDNKHVFIENMDNYIDTTVAPPPQHDEL